MRSDTVTKGKQQAPHRSLFNALGLTEDEMKSIGADDYNAAMRILMCGRREPAAFA